MFRAPGWVILVPLALTIRLSAAEEAKKPVPAAEPTYFDVDRFFAEYDKNKDAFLTKDELPERLRHAFDKIDANKDGKISREELRQGIAYLQPRRRPSDVVFVVIEMSDCDEGCAAEVQRMYDVLRSLDKNKDGKIDADELKAMRQQLVAERVDHLIRELDADKDGKISREEAKGEIKRNFDEIDANKDGYIDRDELLRAATAKPPARGPSRER
jgi:Ca2+-binding EF-hand superfamily protein